jgi:PAS domain S-box-containing protein
LDDVNGLSREALDALPVAIYKTDADGRLSFYNEAAAELWGCRPELGESKFCGSWKLYWPDGTPLPHDECTTALALHQRRPIRGIEAVAERPDGTRIPFIPYPTPLFDQSGRLTGAVDILVDISEQKRVEADLAERQAQLAVFVEHPEDLRKVWSPYTREWNVPFSAFVAVPDRGPDGSRHSSPAQRRRSNQ